MGGRDRRDRRWLLEVLKRYEAPLLRYAQRLTGDAERAKDVVQDALVRLCAAAPGEVDGHVGPWLFAVCRNRAVDVQRKEGRMSPLTETQVQEQASPEASPPAALEAKEEQGQALRLLGGLPENQQEVIRLKFQGGLSYREISNVTGHSVSNVGFLIHAGVKAMRERWEE